MYMYIALTVCYTQLRKYICVVANLLIKLSLKLIKPNWQNYGEDYQFEQILILYKINQ